MSTSELTTDSEEVNTQLDFVVIGLGVDKNGQYA